MFLKRVLKTSDSKVIISTNDTNPSMKMKCLMESNIVTVKGYQVVKSLVNLVKQGDIAPMITGHEEGVSPVWPTY